MACKDLWFSSVMTLYQAKAIEEYFELCCGITILLLMIFYRFSNLIEEHCKVAFGFFYLSVPLRPNALYFEKKKGTEKKQQKNSTLSNQPTASLLAIYVYITSCFNLLFLVSFYCQLLFCSLDCSFLFFLIKTSSIAS